MLEVQNLKYQVGAQLILNDISLQFEPGQFHLIIGPNGSGKSTFIKTIAGEIDNFHGHVLFDGSPLNEISKINLSQNRAVLSQYTELSFPLSVTEVVMLGRSPHFEISPSKKDVQIVHDALDALSLNHLANRNYQTLSGGEKQRVQFARVLAQIWETPSKGHRYLFLDEPLNNLDVYYQQQFLSIAQSFRNNATILIGVVHDINIAMRYAQQLYFFLEGNIVAKGQPESIVTPALLKQVFNIESSLVNHPQTGKPVILL
jgi:iron complex transport system ATP-binding protein